MAYLDGATGWVVCMGIMHVMYAWIAYRCYDPELWVYDLLWLMVAEAWAVGKTTGN
jgi:hypothetical protein